MTYRTTADAFREAVRLSNFAAAERLLGELRAEVEQSWAALTESERRSAAAEIVDLLRWARITAMAGRSQAQSKLAQIRRGGVYAAAGHTRRRHVEIEA